MAKDMIYKQGSLTLRMIPLLFMLSSTMGSAKNKATQEDNYYKVYWAKSDQWSDIHTLNRRQLVYAHEATTPKSLKEILKVKNKFAVFDEGNPGKGSNGGGRPMNQSLQDDKKSIKRLFPKSSIVERSLLQGQKVITRKESVPFASLPSKDKRGIQPTTTPVVAKSVKSLEGIRPTKVEIQASDTLETKDSSKQDEGLLRPSQTPYDKVEPKKIPSVDVPTKVKTSELQPPTKAKTATKEEAPYLISRWLWALGLAVSVGLILRWKYRKRKNPVNMSRTKAQPPLLITKSQALP